MEYEGPAFYAGDRVRLLDWKNKLSGFPRVLYGWVRHIEPARSAHGPTLTISVDDGGTRTLLPHLHGVFKVSAVDTLAALVRDA